jgi:hypothetical protein
MSRRILDFTQEPRDDVFRRLLLAVRERAARVVLVIRDDADLNEGGRNLLSRLEADLLQRDRSASWPGTTLLNEQATILNFVATEAVVKTLANAAAGLYAWQQPDLPEDPALVRSDGSAILATIAHENDAYLEVDDEELAHLIERVPELAHITRLHDDET